MSTGAPQPTSSRTLPDEQSAPADDPRPVVAEVLRGDPTPEELAAVVAVVSDAYRREAEGALAEPAPHASAWQVSARGLRTPLDRDLGWR